MAFLGSRRRENRSAQESFNRFYIVYVVLLGVGFVALYAHSYLGIEILGRLELPEILSGLSGRGGAALLLLFTAGLRYGVWQGPVIFSGPDINLLLSSPLPHASLIRRKLLRGLVAGATIGASAGALLFLALWGSPADAGPALFVVSIVGPALLGLLTAALGWPVERSPQIARQVLRYSPLSLPVAAALVLLPSLLGEPGEAVALLSGPWGWALAPTIAAAGGYAPLWPLALALLGALSFAAAAYALYSTGKAPIEELSRRAELRSTVLSSARVMDYRGAALQRSAAGTRLAGARLPRIKRPRLPLLAVPWRDTLWALRSPGAALRAVILAPAATLAAPSGAGSAPVAFGAILAAYLASSTLLEPIRREGDTPEAARRLPYRRGDLLLLHCLLPALFLSLLAALSLLGGHLSGIASIPPLLPSLALAAPASGVVVLCAAIAARRGPPPLQRLAVPGGEVALGAWFAMGPLLALGALGVCYLLLGQGDGPVACAAVLAGELMVGVFVLRGSRPSG